MLQVTKDSYVEPELAKSILTYYNQKFGIPIDVDRIYKLEADAKISIKENKIPIDNLSPEKIAGFLVHMLKVPEDMLYITEERWSNGESRSSKKLSVDKKMILNPLLESDRLEPWQKEGVKRFIQYRENIKLISSLEGIMKLAKESNLISKFGTRLATVYPVLETTTTSRFKTSKPNMQNINKEINILGVPEGYTLFGVDSSSLEPRIGFSHFFYDPFIVHLINLYGDAYKGIYHFLSIPEEKLASSRENMPNQQIEITKEQRDEVKTPILASLYGKEDFSHMQNKKLLKALKDRLLNNPARAQKKSEIETYVRNGGKVFYSAFGTPIMPNYDERPGDINYAVRCGINNPIQTTASDLMSIAIMELHNKLKMGSGKSFIGLSVYDSLKVWLHEEDMHLADEVRECVSYQVNFEGRDWIPIPCSVDYEI